jgi:hypothetical protein
LYAIKQSVYYSPINGHIENTNINIDIFINELHTLAINNKWFVVVDDFTGKNISDVAFYYDNILKEHIDHIVYGIGVRNDGGCYKNLSDYKHRFIYLITNDGIKVYNCFNKYIKYSDTDTDTDINKLIYKAYCYEYMKFKRKLIMIDIMR